MNYLVKNKKTKKEFGGWSREPESMWAIHKGRANDGKHDNKSFQEDWDKSDTSDYVLVLDASSPKKFPNNLALLDAEGKPPEVKIVRTEILNPKPTLEELILDLGKKKDPATGRRYTIMSIASELNTTQSKVKAVRKDAKGKAK